MSKKKLLQTAVNVLAIYMIITILFAVKVTYVPNILAITIGATIGFFVVGIVWWEMSFCKHETVTGTAKSGIKGKVFVLVFLFLGFAAMGIYGVVYPIHLLLGKDITKVMLTNTAKPLGTRIAYCGTRVAIIDPVNPAHVKTYCAEPEDYNLVARTRPIQKYPRHRLMNVVYKKSKLGYQIIDIQPLNQGENK